MIDPIFQSDTMQLARKLLDASALRQDALAENLANAETPGYHRKDIAPDFAAKLRATVQAGQLRTGGGEAVAPTLTEDKDARAVRTDGNNVEIEHELMVMDQNSVEFSYLSDVVTHNIKQLRMAITGTA